MYWNYRIMHIENTATQHSSPWSCLHITFLVINTKSTCPSSVNICRLALLQPWHEYINFENFRCAWLISICAFSIDMRMVYGTKLFAWHLFPSRKILMHFSTFQFHIQCDMIFLVWHKTGSTVDLCIETTWHWDETKIGNFSRYFVQTSERGVPRTRNEMMASFKLPIYSVRSLIVSFTWEWNDRVCDCVSICVHLISFRRFYCVI